MIALRLAAWQSERVQDLSRRYRILRPVPGASVARVWLAQDRLLGSAVVLKTLPIQHGGADDLVREATLIERLEHPGLIGFIERFEGRSDQEGIQVVGHSTGWVDGVPLERWARGHDITARVMGIAAVVEVVDYLHRSGWLHLDVKPDNLLWTSDGPVLLDLGSAQPADALRGTAGGTLGHAAPEVLLGEAPSTGSDVYSLGVLLYWALAGASPFVETEGTALRTAILRGALVPLRARVSDVDPQLATLVQEMLELQPGERISTTAEVLDRLSSLGAQVARRPGLPPIFGRRDALAELLERIGDPERPPGPIALVGALGSGRTRLARELLVSLPRAQGAFVLDLTRIGPVERSLPALLDLLGAPGAGSLTDPRLARWMQEVSLRGAVFLGRLEDAPWLADHSAVLHGLCRAGLQTVVAAESLPPWAEPYALANLPDEALHQLGVAVGSQAGPRLTAQATAADGLPGGLLRLLRGSEQDWEGAMAALGPDAALVRLLPDGTPLRLIEAGPAELGAVVQRALAVGAIQRIGQRLFGAGSGPSAGPIAPGHADLIRRAVHEGGGSDPWIEGLLLARVGDIQAAVTHLPVLKLGMARPEALEIGRRLGEAGVVEARLLTVHVLINAGLVDQAREELEQLDEALPEVASLWSLWARSCKTSEPWAVSLRWIERHGWHPEIAGDAAWSMNMMRRDDLLDAFLARLDADAPSACAENPYVIAARIRTAVERVRHGAAEDGLRALLADHDARFGHGAELPRIVQFSCAAAWAALGELNRAVDAWRKTVVASDTEGLLEPAATARQSLALACIKAGLAAEARRNFQQAQSIFQAIGRLASVLMTLNNMADLETRAGRLPAAERHLRRFDEVRQQLGLHGEAEARGHLLWAQYHLAADAPRRAIQRLADLGPDGLSPALQSFRAVLLVEASLELGLVEDAERHLGELADGAPVDPNVQRRIQVARGRVHLALARFHLGSAIQDLPQEPGPLDRDSLGRALLAAAGEDLTPSSFAGRREHLQRAASLLQGTPQQRAIALRERMLDRPGADLDQIVSLIESIGDGERFVQGLAKVVATALGAHRVLVMLRIPGLGRQISAQEISGQEVAGLTPEVWRRIRRANDVWRADDAFADPLLRRLSTTVRTFQVKSVVAVAIPRGDEAIGALYVDDLQRPGRFGDEDVLILQRLARAIGAVADQLPNRPVGDGLTVHDVCGVYLSDRDAASRMKTALERLRVQAQGNLLVAGPTGAGKTWIAKRIATEVLGLRDMVQVVLRPSDPDKLISQLWGTRPGEFTGAVKQAGAIQRAWQARAALFLDEVQNLDEAGQRVLLPLLELPHRRFGPMTGEVQQLERPLHIILGTNAPLEDGAWTAHFREDLWFRMSQVRIDLPPLAQRGREAIYRHLGDLLSEKGLPAPERVFDAGALARIATHNWPGNLRGLSGFVDQVAFHFDQDDPLISTSRLNELGLVAPDRAAGPARPASPLLDAEARVLLQTLSQCDWVQTEAADKLNMSKYALHRLLKRHGLLDEVRRRRFGLDPTG